VVVIVVVTVNVIPLLPLVVVGVRVAVVVVVVVCLPLQPTLHPTRQVHPPPTLLDRLGRRISSSLLLWLFADACCCLSHRKKYHRTMNE